MLGTRLPYGDASLTAGATIVVWREEMVADRVPMQRNQPVHVKIGHRACDQRQQRDAPGRRPPNPVVRPPGHRCPPRTSSPVMAGMYVPGDSLLGLEPLHLRATLILRVRVPRS